MYILECSDGSYYTGSTNNLEIRLAQHQSGNGANHTKKRLPVKLVYFEEFQRVDEAFYREKQVQGWSRKKKEALINGMPDLLPKLAIAYRDLRSEGDDFIKRWLREPQPPEPQPPEQQTPESQSTVLHSPEPQLPKQQPPEFRSRDI